MTEVLKLQWREHDGSYCADAGWASLNVIKLSDGSGYKWYVSLYCRLRGRGQIGHGRSKSATYCKRACVKAVNDLRNNLPEVVL